MSLLPPKYLKPPVPKGQEKQNPKTKIKKSLDPDDKIRTAQNVKQRLGTQARQLVEKQKQQQLTLMDFLPGAAPKVNWDGSDPEAQLAVSGRWKDAVFCPGCNKKLQNRKTIRKHLMVCCPDIVIEEELKGMEDGLLNQVEIFAKWWKTEKRAIHEVVNMSYMLQVDIPPDMDGRLPPQDEAALNDEEATSTSSDGQVNVATPATQLEAEGGSLSHDVHPEETPAGDPYTSKYVHVVHATHVAEALDIPLDRVQRRLQRADKFVTMQPCGPAPDVLYEDDELIIVNKQACIATHPSSYKERQGGRSVQQQLLGYLGYIPWVVHRLDYGTSGAMVFAKTFNCSEKLRDLFRQRKVYKTYLALTSGVVSRPSNTVYKAVIPDPYLKGAMKFSTTGPMAATMLESLVANPHVRWHVPSGFLGMSFMKQLVDHLSLLYTKYRGAFDTLATPQHVSDLPDGLASAWEAAEAWVDQAAAHKAQCKALLQKPHTAQGGTKPEGSQVATQTDNSMGLASRSSEEDCQDDVAAQDAQSKQASTALNKSSAENKVPQVKQNPLPGSLQASTEASTNSGAAGGASSGNTSPSPISAAANPATMKDSGDQKGHEAPPKASDPQPIAPEQVVAASTQSYPKSDDTAPAEPPSSTVAVTSGGNIPRDDKLTQVHPLSPPGSHDPVTGAPLYGRSRVRPPPSPRHKFPREWVRVLDSSRLAGLTAKFPEMRKLTHSQPHTVLNCVDGIYIKRKWLPPSTLQVLRDLKDCFRRVLGSQEQAWRTGGLDYAASTAAQTAAATEELVNHSLAITFRGASLVKCVPKSGRRHQVRLHLAYQGTPVMDDDLYGVYEGSLGRLGLHAHELSFEHPTLGQRVYVEAPLHDDFKKCLQKFELAAVEEEDDRDSEE